jgi:hypothetical protein
LFSTYFYPAFAFAFTLPFTYFFFESTTSFRLLMSLLLHDTDRSADEVEFMRFLGTFVCPN